MIMRKEMLETLRVHFTSHILKHKMNVEVMLNNPIAIHDHTDIMTAMENEIASMAEYKDKLEVLEKYFPT
jgi:hypothetical protein